MGHLRWVPFVTDSYKISMPRPRIETGTFRSKDYSTLPRRYFRRLFESEFYGECIIIRKYDFPYHFKKIIIRYKKDWL